MTFALLKLLVRSLSVLKYCYSTTICPSLVRVCNSSFAMQSDSSLDGYDSSVFGEPYCDALWVLDSVMHLTINFYSQNVTLCLFFPWSTHVINNSSFRVLHVRYHAPDRYFTYLCHDVQIMGLNESVHPHLHAFLWHVII